MAFPQILKATSLLLILVVFFFANPIYGARSLFSLYKSPHMLLKYHNGALLDGVLPVSIIWYGKFTPPQKSIILDFLLSLNPTKNNNIASPKVPTVSHWWKTVQNYVKIAGKKPTNIILTDQIYDNYSLGKSLKKSHVELLARSKLGGLTLILTSQDVTMEGFCMSNCGYHGWATKGEKKSVFIWVGNSVSQCPGQCAWPFHQPIYGPQSKPLGAPNGDVGMDGMVVNIASLLAGAVTNPFRNGYFQGSAGAPLEAASACPGVYGKGAYPGYAGELLVDRTSGASYNALGTSGRKYLLPALFDPNTSQCSTIV